MEVDEEKTCKRCGETAVHCHCEQEEYFEWLEQENQRLREAINFLIMNADEIKDTLRDEGITQVSFSDLFSSANKYRAIA